MKQTPFRDKVNLLPPRTFAKASGLIWIQTVWHSDGIPEIIFQKS